LKSSIFIQRELHHFLTKMSSSIHLTSLNKLSKPIFFWMGPQRSLRGGKRKNNYIMVYNSPTHPFFLLSMEQTQNLSPHPRPLFVDGMAIEFPSFCPMSPSRLRRGVAAV